MSDRGDDSKPSTPASPSSNRSRAVSPPQPSDAASCQIQVFARIRPSKQFSPNNLTFDPYNNSVTLTLPTPASLPSTTTAVHADQFTRDYINNQRLVYPFTFHGLFPPSTTQDTVFDTIGKQCVTSLLDGYNSTIFAYGQTGSGKTYTITGGADSYEDRGIIPRTLSYLFQQLEGRQAGNVAYVVRVSYLEIYNEAGYDLLDRPADMSDLASIAASSLASLPRVTLLEDDNRCVHLQNLGEYAVTNVQDALELLFRGDTNRIVCETPSNDASSRSHCLFTVTLEARDAGSGKLRRSKLHLVDLAGSERIKKTQVTGRLFKEAAFINLSLHHLEQVILALHHRSTGRATVHVPYRNSFLTSTLRDSLGGNCRTYMIATLSGEPHHIDESVSTARFAGRVGSIRNEVWREEEEDVEGVMKRLKGQVKELKEEVRRLRGEEGVGRGEVLSDEDKERCREVVRRYVWCAAEEEAEVSQQVSVAHQEKVRYYLKVMKDIIRSGSKADGGNAGAAAVEPVAVQMEAEVRRLNDAVQEREKEIARLKEALLQLHQQQQQQPPTQPSDASHDRSIPRPSSSSTSASSSARTSIPHPSSASSFSTTSEVSLDTFRQQYAQHEQLEQRKDELNALIRTAKSLGESINASKQHILHLKQRLTAHTLNRTLAQQDNQPADALAPMEAAERAVVGEMEEEKRRYRERFVELKVKKEEIVHLQGLIERGRRKMEIEFDKWKKAREGTEEADAGGGDEREEEQQREEVQSGRRGDAQNQRLHQAPLSRPMDKRSLYEEMKEQVTSTPQQQLPYQPAGTQSTSRDSHLHSQSQHAAHSSIPMTSPLRAGALSSLMLGQSPAASPPRPPVTTAGGNTVSATGSSTATRLVRTGSAAADAEIDKFWALRDKLKSHAATMQSAVATALK